MTGRASPAERVREPSRQRPSKTNGTAARTSDATYAAAATAALAFSSVCFTFSSSASGVNGLTT